MIFMCRYIRTDISNKRVCRLYLTFLIKEFVDFIYNCVCYLYYNCVTQNGHAEVDIL